MYKKFGDVPRLVISIMALVLSMVVLFQACAAGTYNVLSESDDLGGTAGFIVALLVIAAGVVGIATRRSEGNKGMLVTAVLFLFAALIGFMNSAVFQDLMVWGILFTLFGLFFILCFMKSR